MPFAVWCIALVLAIFLRHVPRWIYQHLRRIYYARKLPSIEPTEWITGNSRHVLPENFTDTLQRMMARTRRNQAAMVRCDLTALMPCVIVYDTKIVQELLTAAIPKSDYLHSFTTSMLGCGLPVTNGKTWSTDRKLLNPAFHPRILPNYAEIYCRGTEVLITKLKGQPQLGDADKSRNPVRIALADPMHALVLDVLLQCSMSHQSNCQLEHCDIIPAADTWSKLVQRRVGNVLYHPDFIYTRTAEGQQHQEACRRVHDIVDGLVAGRLEELNCSSESPLRSRDMLGILLSARTSDGRSMAAAEIRDQLVSFLLCGLDSTADTLQWALYYLAGDPAVQEKCRKEAREVLCAGGAETPSNIYTGASQLTSITDVIMETLRLAPPMHRSIRELPEDATMGGYFLAEGTRVVVSLWALHHNPQIWHDPLKFDPSRFHADSGLAKQPTSDAFLPFSTGPRNCIGQGFALALIRVILVLLLLEFKFSQPADMHDMQSAMFVLSTRPKKPIELLMERV
eukprot:scpid53876/ scgid22687/ Taurochenodeoxycholic 6 alpha-hydroxylase; CYPIVA21; Cytochrome P450 4A21